MPVDLEDLLQMFADDDVESIRELIREIYTEEVEQLEIDPEDETDQQEAIRSFVERVALRAALTCAAVDSSNGVEIGIPSQTVTEIVQNLLKQGSISLTVHVE